MSRIVWDERTFGTGVPTVDAQHKRLISMINDLLTAVDEGHGKDEIGRILDFLVIYAAGHFTHEQCVMVERKCPAARTNADEHAKFMEAFTALKARFDDEGPTPAVVMEVQKSVVTWLTRHIARCDAQLRKSALAR
jgi:hemerythrin